MNFEHERFRQAGAGRQGQQAHVKMEGVDQIVAPEGSANPGRVRQHLEDADVPDLEAQGAKGLLRAIRQAVGEVVGPESQGLDLEARPLQHADAQGDSGVVDHGHQAKDFLRFRLPPGGRFRPAGVLRL